MNRLIFALMGICVWPRVVGWYLPGAAPREYDPGATIPVVVNKLTSSKAQVPYSYYKLPYCKPEVLHARAESVGEMLKGDVMENTLYDIKMLVEENCKTLCVKPAITALEKEQFISKIDEEYMVNLLADNLPAAISIPNAMDPAVPILRPGFPVGFPVMNQGSTLMDADKQKGLKHALVNHLNFVIKYHSSDSGARVVGLEVLPESIVQSVKGVKSDNQFDCNSLRKLLVEDADEIAFTYSVSFKESPIQWATRWDVYLESPAAGSAEVHWFSVINSLVIVLLLSGIVAMILLRTLLRDISRYNELDDAEDAQEEGGWKLVHGDVFRRPNHSKLLAVCAGTGVQILLMTCTTLVFALLGLLSPSNRGALIQALLVLFTFMGLPAGFVSARFNKLFQGEDTRRSLLVTLLTAALFPGVCFSFFFIINIVLWSEGSSAAVSFGTLSLLLLMWFGISFPLVFFGGYLGYRRKPFAVPVRTNQIPRQIPPRQWLMHPILSHAISGLLPFGAVFTELLFIMGSIWQHQFYYLFGFLSLVVVILVITCAEVSIAFTYFQLCGEDYGWWWRSYWCAASSAVYLFLYGIFYFFVRLELSRASAVLIYFGYMFLASYAFFLVTGAVGFISSFYFVRAIYGAVKVD